MAHIPRNPCLLWVKAKILVGLELLSEKTFSIGPYVVHLLGFHLDGCIGVVTNNYKPDKCFQIIILFPAKVSQARSENMYIFITRHYLLSHVYHLMLLKRPINEEP